MKTQQLMNSLHLKSLSLLLDLTFDTLCPLLPCDRPTFPPINISELILRTKKADKHLLYQMTVLAT